MFSHESHKEALPMKFFKSIIILLAAIVLLAACNSGNDGNGEPYEYDADVYDEIDEEYYPEAATDNNETDEPTSANDDTEYPEEAEEEPPELSEEEQQLVAEMAHFLAMLQSIWDEDNGTMWGIPLHVPIVLVCGDTQLAVANRPSWQRDFVPQYVDGNLVYVGTRRPVGFYVYVNWDGVDGVIWSWQYIQSSIYAGGLEDILRTIFHTGFHAIQMELMGFRGAGMEGLSDSNDAWISFGLEANALIQALKSTGEERLAIIHDALSIRDARRQASRTAADAENWLKISEGTTTYTDLHLVLAPDEAVYFIIDRLRVVMEESYDSPLGAAVSTAIGFAYVGGAAYGILLDAVGAEWRPYVDRYTDLGLMLKEALGISEFIPLDEINLERYGYSEVVAMITNT